MMVSAEPIVFALVKSLLLSVIQPQKAPPALKYSDKFIGIYLFIVCLQV